MEEERRKHKVIQKQEDLKKKSLEIFLLAMTILFIGISCFISYRLGCEMTERRYIRENATEIQEVIK